MFIELQKLETDGAVEQNYVYTVMMHSAYFPNFPNWSPGIDVILIELIINCGYL